jgi:ABC-type amino acid transport substrate-binding protein
MFKAKLLLIFFCSLLIILPSSAIAERFVITTPPQSKFDISHGYFIGLLELILDKTSDKYGAVDIRFSEVLQQGRAIVELENNRRIDVYWAGTSINREERLGTIRIPLIKGMLGIRQFIVRQSNLDKFKRVKTLTQLAQFRACQGAHWPDSDVLEQAGLSVIRNPVYEDMFKQLSAKRCDYFPRGIHEGKAEVASRKNIYPDLVWYENIILNYPFAMYFFVSKQRSDLKQRIEEGLQLIIADGSFKQYMQSHPITASLFPLKQWLAIPRLSIINHQLPLNTPINDRRYWFSFE